MKREKLGQIQLRTTKEAHNETSTVMAVLACEDNESLEDEVDNRSQLPSPLCPACDERRGRVQSSTMKTRQTLLGMPHSLTSRGWPAIATGHDMTGQSFLLSPQLASLGIHSRDDRKRQATGACDESRREGLTPVALTDDQDKTSRPLLAKQRLGLSRTIR
jgi:hypothetical protein